MKRLMGILLLLFLLIPSLPTTAQGDDSLCDAFIRISDTVEGTIDDENWNYTYCFEGIEGQEITISINATSGDLDTYLWLQNTNEEIIAFNDDTGGSLNSRIITTLTQNGTYIIFATRYAYEDGSSSGSFELQINDGNALTCDSFISTDDLVTGGIDNTDWEGVYCFEGTAGQDVTISMNAISGDLDPLLMLLDSSEQIIVQNDDANGSLNSQITITLPQTGTFIILASRYQGGSGSSNGDYELQLHTGISETSPTTANFDDGVELNNLGLQADREGRYDDALVYYEEALAIFRNTNDRQAEGTTLNNIGSVYLKQEQYDLALDFLNQALMILREIDDRPGEGDALFIIGVAYRMQEQYDLALDFLNQALTIDREIGNRPGEAATLGNIGAVYDAQGQFDLALEFYNQALTILREVGDRPSEGTTLNNIGGVYDTQGQLDLALDFYNQALTIRREVGDRPGEGRTLNNIGGVYDTQGQLDLALEFFNQALAIDREIDNRPGEGITLNNIGGVYADQGQFDLALEVYNQALAIDREIDNRPGEGITLGNIGNIYQQQGQFDLALEFFNQALIIFREVSDRPSEGTALNNIGNIYQQQGQFNLALDLYNQALTISREIGDRLGEGAALNSIGNIYTEQGQYDLALDFYNQALAIVREVGDRPSEGTTLNNIGNIYTEQGQYDLALEFYNQALTIHREVGNRPGEGTTLNNIGRVYLGQEQFELALDFYNQSLAIDREIGNRPGEGTTLSNIGVVYDDLGQFNDAIISYRDSIEVRESVLQTTGLDAGIAGLAADFELTYTRLTTLLLFQGDPFNALNYAERGRGILVRDELRNNPIDFRANIADERLLEQEEALRLEVVSAQASVDTLAQDILASAADIQNTQRELEEARAAYNAHLEVMQLQGGFLARELALDVASLEEIQAVLNPNETLLLYGASEIDTYAIFVTQTDLQGFVLDADLDELEPVIRAFNTDRRANASALQDLYTLLFAPIANEITTSNLIISPTGILNYVPFAALQNPDTGRYLIEDYTISNTPSGTALVLLRERQNQSTAEASSNGLILSQRDAPGLQPLRNADSEAQTIAANLNATSITSATESDLRNNSTGAEIIHISAHAELDRFAPLFSTIHLGADDEHDGRFEVREIYELDLTQGTELVVLSGCETGSGGTGEDFGLLNRAFFGAGAPRVVSSLWAVDDEATAVLLTRFYENLETTDNYAEALRMAMLDTMADYPEPYFWAPFVLTGLPE